MKPLYSTDDEHATNIRRDVGSSFAIGAVGFALSGVGFLFLYPLIVSDFGFEVLGLWSLIAAVATVLRSADAGFSQLIQREGGSDRSPDELSIVKRELVSVRVAYIALFLVASSALAATAVVRSFITATTDY